MKYVIDASTAFQWEVPEPDSPKVRDPVTLGVDDVLDGGDVLTGLRISVRDLFELGE
jgi:hypothetical protein